ncbi:hypothetical protein ACSIGC_09455 [Tenacibaculum sp. ZS6-P6]|uniref:hypothetical protein n=1 Tax=Tenacibaculum sp. ZS6-P6 TaxID=3447503 RepID=UPI003F985AC2
MNSFTMAEAGNTYNYALTTIIDKGFKVFIIPDQRENYFGEYWAINNTHKFIGSSPLVILGLIGVWEKYGDDWWENHQKTPKNYLSILENRAFPDCVSDFENISESDFKIFVSEYQLLFKATKAWNKFKITENITRKELFYIVNNYWKEENHI